MLAIVVVKGPRLPVMLLIQLYVGLYVCERGASSLESASKVYDHMRSSQGAEHVPYLVTPETVLKPCASDGKC